MTKGKLLIFSAPSGAGKTTIVREVLKEKIFQLEFSVSACSREKRVGEINGKDYYFLSIQDFKQKIENQDFIEWQEVYRDHFYGSLKTDVEKIRNSGNNVIFDVDVKGGLNIKQQFENDALCIFIMPPSIVELERRLVSRSTDSPEIIKKRMAKAEYELTFADKFDFVILNDNLEIAIQETKNIINKFLKI